MRVQFFAISVLVFSISCFQIGSQLGLGSTVIIQKYVGTGNANWTQINGNPTPPQRIHRAMSFDSDQNKVILFGGNVNGVIDNSTWLFDPNTQLWVDVSPSISPPGQNYHAMSYDTNAKKTILFGGIHKSIPTNETWEYDTESNTWTNRNPISAPSIRRGHQMIFDPTNDRTILFGGIANPPGGGLAPVNDLWEYTYTTNEWSQIETDVSPSPRHTSGMVLDSKRQQIILFGGNFGYHKEHFLDTWVFDLNTNTWTEINTSTSPTPPRGDYDMIYDPNYDQVMLVGGYSVEGTTQTFGDTWIYLPSENIWIQLEIDGPSPEATDGGLIYDNNNNQTILSTFGLPGGISETWIYKQKGIITYNAVEVTLDDPNSQTTLYENEINTEDTEFHGWVFGLLLIPIIEKLRKKGSLRN